MADFVFARKTRNVASGAVQVFLNILLGIAAVIVTVFSGNPIIGILLVLISKWRVFAVRSRFLWLNIKANLVDFIVGISVVLLANVSGGSLQLVHILLIIFYVIWLLLIKPRSSEMANMVQSLIAVFMGISAVAILTAETPTPAVIFGASAFATMLAEAASALPAIFFAFMIGYSASRHVLAQTGSEDFTFTTLICGLIFAEVMWLCHIWNIIYTYGATGIMIPQAAIILTIFAFVYNYARQTMVRYREDFRFRNIFWPVLFSAVLIGAIVIFFSPPIFDLFIYS